MYSGPSPEEIMIGDEEEGDRDAEMRASKRTEGKGSRESGLLINALR